MSAQRFCSYCKKINWTRSVYGFREVKSAEFKDRFLLGVLRLSVFLWRLSLHQGNTNEPAAEGKHDFLQLHFESRSKANVASHLKLTSSLPHWFHNIPIVLLPLYLHPTDWTVSSQRQSTHISLSLSLSPSNSLSPSVSTFITSSCILLLINIFQLYLNTRARAILFFARALFINWRVYLIR